MSVAKKLNEIDNFFIQECPLCGRSNRIVVLGVYRRDQTFANYPDIGYSFCNCKNIFYTRFENLNSGVDSLDADPVHRMRRLMKTMKPGEHARLTLPDPFFCEWGNDPYKTFLHWNPRQHFIIWDKEQFEDEMLEIGFEIVLSRREFDVHREDAQQTFEIVLKKPGIAA